MAVASTPYRPPLALTSGQASALVVLAGLALLALISANPLLSLASVLLPVVLFALLWRPGEPPALLYAMGYHWIQATILVFYADLGGLALRDTGYGPMVDEATWLTLAGVLAVALGARLGAGGHYAAIAQPSVAAIAARLSVRRLFWASLVAIGVSLVLTRVAFFIPGLTQPIVALTLLRWVTVFLFAYVVLSQHRGYRWLGIVVTVEIVIGFLGFFSGFRTVLIVMLLAALTAPESLRGMRLRTAVLMSVAILTLAVAWTGIKSDYRQFLNQGTRQQVVLVPVVDRVAKLVELTGQLDAERLNTSVQRLMERLTYVYYFGRSMQVVPDYLPYEHGKLWGEAIENAVVPRLIDPSKRIIDDSERTSLYSGTRVAGASEGTSISLGYIAESYIDFGPILMMFPLFLWGIFLGRVYSWLMRSTRYPLLGYASAAVVVALGASVLESSNLKMVAGVILGFLALFTVQKLAGGKLLRLLARPTAPAA